MIKEKIFKSVGILGWGGYLPYWRIKVEEVAQNWRQDGEKISKSLGVEQKAIAAEDEDCVTMAAEAARIALKRAGISPKKIGAVFVGSESHPYAVKPTGTILADILGVGNDYFCVDLQFACKAATTGLQIVAAMIESGMIDYGLVAGSDKAQSEPGDALEYTAGAGAGAFILGKKKESAAAFISTYSFSSDTPDFWRRQGSQFPSHAGRFTGKPGYFYHLETCIKNFLKRIKKGSQDFDYVIFHMPNAKFPLKTAKSFGFSDSQLKPGFLVSQIGNPYSASSLLGLASVLDQAKANQDILLVSYGSGAGSDAFWFRTRKTLKQMQKNAKTLKTFLDNFKEIDYCQYLKNYEILE